MVLGFFHAGFLKHNRSVIHEAAGSKAIIQCRAINKGLKARAWLAFGLSGTVVITLLERKAANQCTYGAVYWVKRGQCCLCSRDLDAVSATISLLVNAHKIAELRDIRWALRAWPHAVRTEKWSSPFHAAPSDGLFLPIAGKDQNATFFNLTDDGWLQAATWPGPG